MKNILTTVVGSFIAVQAIHPIVYTNIKLVKKVNPLQKVTVAIKDPSSDTLETIPAFRNNTVYEYHLSKRPGLKIITATMKSGTTEREINERDLYKNEIHIVKSSVQPGFAIQLVPAAPTLPKKQSIQAYTEDYTNPQLKIVITNAADENISHSEFKSNTDYKAKKLYLQLNSSLVPSDLEGVARYNSNTITVYDKNNNEIASRKILARIFKPGSFNKPGNRIKVSRGNIDIVDSSGNSILQRDDSEISTPSAPTDNPSGDFGPMRIHVPGSEYETY